MEEHVLWVYCKNQDYIVDFPPVSDDQLEVEIPKMKEKHIHIMLMFIKEIMYGVQEINFI